MRRNLTFGLAFLSLIFFSNSSLVSAQEAVGLEAEAEMPEVHFDVFDKYCLECHDSLTEKGEVNLEDLSFSLIENIQTAETWNKVLNSINSGEMPPEDEPQISAGEKTEFLRDLSEKMVIARSVLSDSGGEIEMRRLNRREYANTLEDLLGVRPDVSFLPDDQASSEFDTMGASLFFSSDQLEQYLKTARNSLELALNAKAPKESTTVHIEPEDIFVPLYADLAVKRLDTASRYYQWRAKGGTDDTAKEFGFLDGWQAERNINSFKSSFLPLEKWLTAPENRTGASMMVTIKSGFTSMKLPQVRAWQPGKYLIRLRAGAYEDDPERFRFLEFVRKEGQNSTRLGWRKVTASLRKPEVIEFEIDHAPGVDAIYQVQKRSHMDRGDKNLEAIYRKENTYGTPWGVWIDWVELEGPLPVEANESSLSILSEKQKGQSDDDYVKGVLRDFAGNAFRGEAPSDEFLEKLFRRYSANRKKGQEMKEALMGPLAIILSSPSFLYMVESDESGDSRELTQNELAVRLAYFLWSSPPDPELLSLAGEGKLKNPEVLAEQTGRLLSDPRSDRFVRSFAYQWLEMHRLGMFAFAGRDFPTFDNAVRDCAAEEIYETFSTLMHEGLSLKHFLKSDFVVVNDVLAGYYGLEGVDGHHWRKVALPADSPRGGLLGSVAIAAMGSDGQRSSPVERGAWVLRKLLNDPPPPAPPNVPMLSRFEDEILSVRDLQKAHQEQPQCAQCHEKIDPIGFGMENLDAAGMWRDIEVVTTGKKGKNKTEFTIEPAGSFGQGNEFSDFFELRDEVAEEIDGFAMGMTEALITYGLGRPFGFTDHDLAHEIVAHASEHDYKIEEFVRALIQSKAFQSK
ncbi:DUF1592 domain-containing protein [Verrucomicrobiales bacterium]|nr:DUF1592 domain-containing protein [Verrucomicrobiales bacterium]MDB4359056.1 DUF1592 domain-containing protein [Verrucomicrobiales bacterium]